MKRLTIAILLPAVFIPALAQPYRCDWQVAATGGGLLTGGYLCGATCGQTATGLMREANLLALIGFWQPELITGIAEKERFHQQTATSRETRLAPPAPNPFSGTVLLSYTLNGEQRTSIRIYDLAGRVVRTLVDAPQPGGSYALVWDGRDNSGRQLAHGIYLCRFTAGAYQQTVKLLLQR
jgi:hypothetical protein